MAMKKIITSLFILFPLLASSQEVQELYRIPLSAAGEYNIGVAVESNRKANSAVMGVDGQV